MNYDYTRLRSGVLPGFGNTTPIDAFKNGDFSALLTGNQIATDALGGRSSPARSSIPHDAAGQRHPGPRSLSRATSSPPTTRCGAWWRHGSFP